MPPLSQCVRELAGGGGARNAEKRELVYFPLEKADFYVEFYSLGENIGEEEEDKSNGAGAVATGEPLPQPGRCGKASEKEYIKERGRLPKSHNPN